MPKITIFTPSYNRANLLQRLYDSLCSQTTFNFEWIIFDDGSVDGTNSLVQAFVKKTSAFEIKYYKSENIGKHKAINFILQSINLAKGKYFFIVDSDDWLFSNACAWVEEKFDELENATVDKNFAGISGLIKFTDRKNSAAKDRNFVDAKNDQRAKYGLLADQCEVFYTDVIKRYPFPEYKDENFLTEAIVWNRLAKANYYLRYFNEYIYNREYQDDGLSKSGWGKFFANPKGTFLFAKEYLFMGKYRGSLRDKAFWLFAIPVFAVLRFIK